jgi:hypothetical protein
MFGNQGGNIEFSRKDCAPDRFFSAQRVRSIFYKLFEQNRVAVLARRVH